MDKIINLKVYPIACELVEEEHRRSWRLLTEGQGDSKWDSHVQFVCCFYFLYMEINNFRSSTSSSTTSWQNWMKPVLPYSKST